MSKVYIVTQGAQSDYCIDSVFSNKEQAEKRALLIADQYNEDAYVEEYELDEILIRGDVYKYYEVTVNSYNDLYVYRTYGKQKPEEMTVRKTPWGVGYSVTGIRADDEETAMKIAQDAVAKYRYRRVLEEGKDE